jgi:prepilin-type N-terminal cleavage/methylation domain-containing protein
MRRRNTRRAFTLIEMLTVIAIIMLVMAMAVPNFLAMLEHRRWVAAVSAFQNVVRRCRIFAINERRDYSIEFCEDADNETQYFRIEVESSLLERIPELNAYFRDQCDYEPDRLPVDWRLCFKDAGGTIENFESWHRRTDTRFIYNGPIYDVDRQTWGVDERVKDNLCVDDSDVLPHGIRVDFDASVNIINYDGLAQSLNHVPQYGWDYTKDLRFDARGTLVQTQNPEIVLKDKAGQMVRLQVLRSTGRIRKLR